MSLAPRILKASIESNNTIKFTVTTAFNSKNVNNVRKLLVRDTDGKTYAINGITSKEGVRATTAVIEMRDELDVLKNYMLFFYGYGKINILNSKIFSTKEFEEAYYYSGNDLGASWSKERTVFRVWAPTASEVALNLYEAGSGTNLIESIIMTKDLKGTWVAEKQGDLNCTYYTYSVNVNQTIQDAVDPYAKAVGVNGDRGMVINLDEADPENFQKDVRPAFNNLTDAIIYELSIRDFSADDSSGTKNKGKYLAFTENGTISPTGEKTGIDYLKNLGITHMHLLSPFDYSGVDEVTPVNNHFNWGFNSENYNVPEGSYSTDPQHGEVGVKEYKQMVQSLHTSGIRLVMDVIYHSTASTTSNFNKIVPGYYYRMDEGESSSEALDTGNETASKRIMMRKFIVDSVVYWATEYHVDGFRFDLNGIHDTETINEVREALNKIDPSILVYIDGWTDSSSTLPEGEQVLKQNMSSVSKTFWAMEPTQTITYSSSPVILNIWDKIVSSNASDSFEDRIKMNLLSGAILFTSQGIPFFRAGEEFLRSKTEEQKEEEEKEAGAVFEDNNAVLPENSMKWENVSVNKDVVNYYKGLIAFRKAHNALRVTKTSDIQTNLTFLQGLDANVVGYTISNSANGELAKALCIIYNANKSTTTVRIPEGDWNVYIKGDRAGIKVIETISGGTITVEPISALVLVQEEKKTVAVCPTSSPASNPSNEKSDENSAPASKKAERNKCILYFGIAIVVITLIVIGNTIIRRKNTK